ncbi:MAG: hypothetical protein KGJ86_03650 [Chloroflexota bacterium]|nr:hypothetical protein [Chloroflexota bacterium]
MIDRLLLPTLIVVGVILLGWYLVGNEIMRRRGRTLAVWCKRALDPLGGKQAIQWLTLHAFRLETEAKDSPIRQATLTGLVESWDVPLIWLWNRLNWRRDMVLAQLTLRQQPLAGIELYRPRSVLAGDARLFARREGWEETALDEFRLAAPDGLTRDVAARLLDALGAERRHLIRLALRRQGVHLTLALNVPHPSRLAPEHFQQLLQKLAQVAGSP